jgi:GTP-binding protein
VVDIDKQHSLLMADIPGLIEGAAKGKGLGHDFLRHVERTAVLLHLIDAYVEDVGVAYKTIRAELKAYQPRLLKHPEVVALTKVEGLDEEILDDLTEQLQKAAPKGTPVFTISALANIGLKPLLFTIKERVDSERAKKPAPAPDSGVPVLKLTDTADAYTVAKKGKTFVVSGERIEKFARRTDFNSEEGLQRLRDIMRRAGIMHELRRQGIEPGQTIQIANSGHFEY